MDVATSAASHVELGKSGFGYDLSLAVLAEMETTKKKKNVPQAAGALAPSEVQLLEAKSVPSKPRSPRPPALDLQSTGTSAERLR